MDQTQHYGPNDEERWIADQDRFTQDEPGECWATRWGQRETHDLRNCEHFKPIAPAEVAL